MFGISYKTNVTGNLQTGRHPYSMWFPLPEADDSKVPLLRDGYWNSVDTQTPSKTSKRDFGSPSLNSNAIGNFKSDKLADYPVESFLAKDTNDVLPDILHKNEGDSKEKFSKNSQSRDGSLCWMISSTGELYLSLQKISPECSSPEKQSSVKDDSMEDNVGDKTTSSSLSSESSPCRTGKLDLQLEETSKTRGSSSPRASPSPRKCISLKFGIDSILKDREKESATDAEEQTKSHHKSNDYDRTLASSSTQKHHDDEPGRRFPFLQNFRLADQGGPMSLALRSGLMPPHSQFLASLCGQHNPSRPFPLSPIHSSQQLSYFPHGFPFQNLPINSSPKFSSQQLAGGPGFKSPLGQPDALGSARGGAMNGTERHGSHLTLHYPSRLPNIGTSQKDLLHLRTGDFNSGGSFSIMSNSHRDFNSSSSNLHGSSKKKRSWSRAVFSNLQRKGLEKRFDVQKYVTKPDRRQLAAMLGLTDAQVKVWFQNRRMKWRHQEEAAKKKKEEDLKRQQLQTKQQQVTSSEDYPESSANWSGSQENLLSPSIHSDEERVDVDSCLSDDEEIHPDSEESSLDQQDGVFSCEDSSRSVRLNDSALKDGIRSGHLRNLQGASDILDLRTGTL